jgi:hypothetical protein
VAEEEPAKAQSDTNDKSQTVNKSDPKPVAALPSCVGTGSDGQACGQEKKDVVAERMSSGFVRNLGNAPPTDIQIRGNGATEPVESK